MFFFYNKTSFQFQFFSRTSPFCEKVRQVLWWGDRREEGRKISFHVFPSIYWSWGRSRFFTIYYYSPCKLGINGLQIKINALQVYIEVLLKKMNVLSWRSCCISTKLLLVPTDLIQLVTPIFPSFQIRNNFQQRKSEKWVCMGWKGYSTVSNFASTNHSTTCFFPSLGLWQMFKHVNFKCKCLGKVFEQTNVTELGVKAFPMQILHFASSFPKDQLYERREKKFWLLEVIYLFTIYLKTFSLLFKTMTLQKVYQQKQG